MCYNGQEADFPTVNRTDRARRGETISGGTTLKCPYCGSVCADDALFCPNCKQPLPTEAGQDARAAAREPRTPMQKLGIALLTLMFLAALGVGAYKLVTWIGNYQLTRLYTRGAYTPTVSAVQMDDLRSGHAVVFYGKDGDQVFLPEMNRSLTISGGVARMEIADSDWFDLNVSDLDYADITLSPQLISESGIKTRLPLLNFKIDVPESPLLVTSPASERITVVTGIYPLTLNVVPGSTLFINGEDVTNSVDRSGYLSTNVAVKPIGDNVITLIVRTPKHRERRTELVIYREHYDIELELDTTVSDISPARTMAVTGTTEPGAVITVDTSYIPESLTLDMETGRFSFISKFATNGDNIVRFRASKEGRQDAVISFTVNYRPSLAEISKAAWKMDYKQLQVLFQNWRFRAFACKGMIIDVVRDGDKSYMIMDVGDEEKQLVALENQTTNANPTSGRRYLAYAYVDGQFMYNSVYYPKLVALYIDLAG